MIAFRACDVAALPPILKFPTLVTGAGDDPLAVGPITLRRFYEVAALPTLLRLVELREMSARSLAEDRVAVRQWERCTEDVDIREIDSRQVELLQRGLVQQDLSAATVNKIWRELRGILALAVQQGYLREIPSLDWQRRSTRGRSRLVRQEPKRQREPITVEEFARYFEATKFATYPARGQFPAPELWKAALCVFWAYGPRTLDVFRRRHADVTGQHGGLFSFEAMKTSKLQGLPLLDYVRRAVLRVRGHAERIFPGFNSPGALVNGKWKAGYYATWRSEICAGAGSQCLLKHFRERVVTYYNGLEPGLGAWIAGHSVPGVTAQYYDLPTERIRRAMEAAPVPECILNWLETPACGPARPQA